MRLIRFFLRVLQLAIILFICHLALIALLAYLLTGDLEVTGGYTIPHSYIAVSLYYFVFGFWGYLMSSAIYIFILGDDKKRSKRYLKGLFIVIFGYILSRIPDIIDNDFFNKFSWGALFGFILLLPVLVEVEFWLRGTTKKVPNKQ